MLSNAAGKAEGSRNNCYGNHVMGLKKSWKVGRQREQEHGTKFVTVNEHWNHH